MTYYTTIHRKCRCPLWLENISIEAKYYFLDDTQEYLAKFSRATCPIVENLRLPLHKQNKEFSFFRYCNVDDCPCLKGFKANIDVRKDGYSQ